MKNKSIASIGVAMLAATAFIGCGDDSIEIKNTDVLSQLDEGLITEEQIQANIETNVDTYEEIVEDVNANTEPEIAYEDNALTSNNPFEKIPEDYYELYEADGKTYHIYATGYYVGAKVDTYLSPTTSYMSAKEEYKKLPDLAKFWLTTRQVADTSNAKYPELKNLGCKFFNKVYKNPDVNSTIIDEPFYIADFVIDYQCVENQMFHITYTNDNGEEIEGWVENDYSISGLGEKQSDDYKHKRVEWFKEDALATTTTYLEKDITD